MSITHTEDSATLAPVAIILTALQIEYLSVRDHLEDIQESTRRGTIYEEGLLRDNESGQILWRVVITQVGAGNTHTALEAERAISEYSPSVALFVGVAGGIKDVRLGDVVAATKAYGYESGTDTATEFRARPDVGESSYALIQRVRAEARNRRWTRHLSNIADKSDLKVHVGAIAAGEKVVAGNRSSTALFLRSNYNDALAVEMEGRGFLVAAHANPQVHALIVRGISDLLDEKEIADASGSQHRAAAAAAAFAVEILYQLRPEIASRPDIVRSRPDSPRLNISMSEQNRIRSRINLLDRIESDWIHGFLEPRLGSRPYLCPDLRVTLSSTLGPYGPRGQIVNNDLVDVKKELIQWFVIASRQLLILGPPGSGKTVAMLRLSKVLFEEARRDSTQPIPLILNLYSWTRRYTSLAEWLIEQANLKYAVSENVARSWLQDGAFLLLLDGLDEVAESERSSCIEAINRHRLEYEVTGMIICSRKSEYYEINATLDIRYIIEVLPLGSDQVATSLALLPSNRRGIISRLLSDSDLHSLTTSPLFLDLIHDAVLDSNGAEETLSNKTADELKIYLLDRYLERKRRADFRNHPDNEGWLRNIAIAMTRYQQSEFFIEAMQPEWFLSGILFRLYRISELLAALFLFVAGTIAIDLISMVPVMHSWSAFQEGTRFGIAFGISFIVTAITLRCSRKKYMSACLGIGLGAAILQCWPSDNQSLAYILYPIPSAAAGIVFAREDGIHLAETLTWSITQLNKLADLIRIRYVMLISFAWLVYYLVSEVFWTSDSSNSDLDPGAGISLASIALSVIPFFLAIALFGVLLGLSASEVPKLRRRPYQGLYRCARNSLYLGVVTFGAVAAWLFAVELIRGKDISYRLLSSALQIGVHLGVLIAIFLGGGSALIKHVILRSWLFSGKVMPLGTVRFLEGQVHRGLLRRIGGGYAFEHRTIQEHLALRGWPGCHLKVQGAQGRHRLAD